MKRAERTHILRRHCQNRSRIAWDWILLFFGGFLSESLEDISICRETFGPSKHCDRLAATLSHPCTLSGLSCQVLSYTFFVQQNPPSLLYHKDKFLLGSVCISSSEIYLAQVKSWRTGWSGCTRLVLKLVLVLLLNNCLVILLFRKRRRCWTHSIGLER